MQRVQVVSQSPAEQCRFLRDDGHGLAHVVETEGKGVDVVNDDRSFHHISQSHQGHHHAGLACTCSSANAHLLVGLDEAADIVEHGGQANAVRHGKVAQLNGGLVRPAWRRPSSRLLQGGLGNHLRILSNSFQGNHLTLLVRGHAHKPVERLGDIESVGDGEARQPGCQSALLPHCQQRRAGHNYSAHCLQPHRQPAVRGDVPEVRSDLGVQAVVVLSDEVLLLAVAPDGGGACQRLREVRVDGRPCN
mmetsp:Transcript_7543/g.10208  ORF Transcript_7543/g.10208 Transcript_7543/m.10208 type:complete len:248 (+) Transcript_7543:660-1403(+)